VYLYLCIFICRGLAAAKPSLVHLVSELLGQQLRGADGTSVHDVYEDASATLALVERELLQESPTPPLPPPAVKVRSCLLCPPGYQGTGRGGGLQARELLGGQHLLAWLHNVTKQLAVHHKV
jgi:hypothetical protein